MCGVPAASTIYTVSLINCHYLATIRVNLSVGKVYRVVSRSLREIRLDWQSPFQYRGWITPREELWISIKLSKGVFGSTGIWPHLVFDILERSEIPDA